MRICVTCGVQQPPVYETCPICNDERQFVGFDGQQWTTPAELRAGHGNTIEQLEDLASAPRAPRIVAREYHPAPHLDWPGQLNALLNLAVSAAVIGCYGNRKLHAQRILPIEFHQEYERRRKTKAAPRRHRDSSRRALILRTPRMPQSRSAAAGAATNPKSYPP